MRRRTVLAVARKDGLDILHNTATLLVLLIPLFLSLLLAFLGHLVVSQPQTRTALVSNPSGSAVEHVLTSSLANIRIVHAASAQDVAAAFGTPGAHQPTPYSVGLVVPAEYEAALRAGRPSEVVLYVNGDDLSRQQLHLLRDDLLLYGQQVVSSQSPARVTPVLINPPLTPRTARTTLNAFYALLTLLSSLVVGGSFMPSLLVEEKERKTLWMLLVSPASLADIVGGKLLVGMSYQVLLSTVALAVQGGFMGQVGFVLLFVLLGSALSIMLGLLVGSVFRTMRVAGVMSGLVALLYLVPGVLVEPMSRAMRESLLVKALEVLPTHYLAQGTFDALQNQGTAGELLLDAGIILGCTLGLFALAVWTLHRQASVLSTV